MTAMDHRIAMRRRTVREAGARRRLGRVLVVIGFFVAVGLIALLLQSPAMAVQEIEIVGADRADVHAVLDHHGVVAGVPTISVRPDAITADIEADPWVARARTAIRWPGTVEITVLEHQPIAWVEIGDTWYRVSASGAVLDESLPSKRAARVEIGGLNGQPGTQLTGVRVTAALEFIASLPGDLRRKAVVRPGAAGTLRARVQGHLVDLGSPVEMREKAASLTALLAEWVAAKTEFSLVSPLRPAIRNPQQRVEGRET